jgi:hypothetical protein
VRPKTLLDRHVPLPRQFDDVFGRSTKLSRQSPLKEKHGAGNWLQNQNEVRGIAEGEQNQ